MPASLFPTSINFLYIHTFSFSAWWTHYNIFICIILCELYHFLVIHKVIICLYTMHNIYDAYIQFAVLSMVYSLRLHIIHWSPDEGQLLYVWWWQEESQCTLRPDPNFSPFTDSASCSSYVATVHVLEKVWPHDLSTTISPLLLLHVCAVSASCYTQSVALQREGEGDLGGFCSSAGSISAPLSRGCVAGSFGVGRSWIVCRWGSSGIPCPECRLGHSICRVLQRSLCVLLAPRVALVLVSMFDVV